MGLDIHLITDNYKEIFDEYVVQNNLHISRSFCYFMSREDLDESQPELDRIGEITGTDISVFYEMESYPNPEALRFFLERAESQEEKDKLLNEAELNKEKLKDNIQEVILTIDQLIEKLSQIENLPYLLLPNDVDKDGYFSNFNTENKDSYTSNNFGDDLRAFQRFLYFAKERGAKTVWFEYG